MRTPRLFLGVFALALILPLLLLACSGSDELADGPSSEPITTKEEGVFRIFCPASTIFAGWRQLVLPVHLLGLDALLGGVGPVAGDVKLQDDGVMDHPVNRRGGGHGVGKDALPLREDQV